MATLLVVFGTGIAASSLPEKIFSGVGGGDDGVVHLRKSASLGVLAFTVTYKLLKFFQHVRHPQLRLAPIDTTKSSPLKKFLLGHLAAFFEQGGLNASLKIMRNKEEEPQLLEILRLPRIWTSNPDDLEHVFNKNISNWKKGRMYTIYQRFLGNGLVTMSDEAQHKVHRRIVGPAFSPKALKHLANVCVPPHTIASVNKLRMELGGGESTGTQKKQKKPMQDWLDNLTFSVIAQAAFKIQEEDTKGSTAATDEIRQTFRDGLEAAFSVPRLIPIIEKLGWKRNAKAAHERSKILRRVETIVQKAQPQGDSGSGGNNDELLTKQERANSLIDYLIHSGQLSKIQVADHSAVFLFAGFETTSTVLGWCLYFLARNPEAQQKLFEEVSSSIGLGQCATLDDVLPSCKYLQGVCKESMRLKAPVPSVPREAVEDDVLPGTGIFIPKGQGCVFHVAPMHLSKKYWGEDAEEFKPERWEEPGFDAKMSKYFMPFIVGRRNCIGKDFAMNEMLLILSCLVRNFEFSWPENAPEPIVDAKPITRPISPISLEVAVRQA